MNIYQPSWVDLAIVVVLIIGMVRGRKRGMSEELLDLLKWLVIVVGASFLYEPIGNFMADMTVFSNLSCYIAVYAAIILGVMGLFSLIKRAVGEKLLESDCFGDSEYYLGILAGGFRYLCVLLVVLSFLHARYYSPDEVNARRETQLNNYGMVLFTFSEIQAEIFHRSFLGNLTEEYLYPLMIRPTAPGQKGLGQNRRAVRARERTLNEILE